MINYPITFKQTVSAQSTKPWKAELLGKNLNFLPVDITREFGGTNIGYAPEDFFAAAIMNCFVATLQYLIPRSGLSFDSLQMQGSLIVDRSDDGKVDMEVMQLDLKLFAPSDPERFVNLIQEVKANCLIWNSVKTKIELNYELLC